MKYKAHKSLSKNTARLKVAALGIVAGVFAGLITCLFRFLLESPFELLNISRSFDDFESLPRLYHVVLPLAGSVILALIFHFTPLPNQRVGLSHVIAKVQNFKGYLPVKNAFVQFSVALVALLSGQSCGREGPSIHLGAAAGSYIGQIGHLPNNTTRTLVACGSAAAIAAAFNTPIAGVLFTMEVIMMEYTIVEFIPVIIAAVSGTVISQVFYGSSPVFEITNVQMQSLFELPYVVLMGLIIGTLAAAFIYIHQYCMSYSSIDIRKRLILIGTLTACVAYMLPEVMGAGYDTINAALRNELTWQFLLILLFAKLLLTAVVLGLGLPGGVIGQSLIIGGLAGAVLGIAGNAALADYPATPGFYILLGMCAMMGAVLQAPLAALMALLELSGNPNLILPAMLVIVVANLTTSELFRQSSVQQNTLQRQGIVTPKTISRLLNRYGVSAILESSFIVLSSEPVAAIQGDEHKWVIVQQDACDENQSSYSTQFRLLASAQAVKLQQDADANGWLTDAFSKGEPLAAIPLQATMQEAMEMLENAQLEYGYVHAPLGIGQPVIMGVISLQEITHFYRNA